MIQEPVEKFVLNAAELKIKSSTFKGNDGIQNLNSIIDENEELLTLKLDNSIESQKGILSISFSGILNDQMR